MIPIRNQILVQPFPSDNVTAGGLLIPDSAKKPSSKVKVIKAGCKSKIKEGETVYRVSDWGTEVIIDGVSHFIMEDNAILARE
jgi:chaperonin GroES